jgi:exodeoxyribonuclease V gamma subunit
MPGMKLFVSNKLEVLAQQLAGILQTPLSSPFQKEIIVVQSKGMERWLSMQLAAHHGICANTSFPFPNAMVNDLFRCVVKDIPEESLFDVDIMAWRIMEKLSSLIGEKGFEGIRHYIEGDTTGIRLYQLSAHLAETFDQYIIFRDEAILRWQEGRLYFSEKDSDLEYWQSVLWRELTAGHEREHRASLKKAFMEALGPDVHSALPERLNIFGLSYLPLFHLEVFYAVSEYIPVNLFLMNPCCQYWGDIRSGSDMAGIFLQSPEADKEELHLEEGNSLLASFGDLGRQLFDVLQDFEIEDVDGFEETAENSMLGCLQSDILNLRNAASESKRIVDLRDTSVQIHSCHSPMREVEVLYDNLLALFDKNPELKPEDIVVMTPDIETYAPFIQAVFDTDRDNSNYLPFSIADRTLRTQSDLADTFLSMLDLADARSEASRILSLLESEPLQKKFTITDNDLELIQNWVLDTRICWGRDGENKQELGLPGFVENTWRFGMERLLLGYAMHSGQDRDFAGILPYDNMEGDDAIILGNFLSFVSMLFDHIQTLKQARSLGDWSFVLTGLLEEFFYVDEAKESDFQYVRRILTGLAGIQKETGYDEAVSLDVVRAYIGRKLQVKAEGMGFLSSGVTFCAMLPMRSIPFTVVCLLGMNHTDYPRHFRPKGFDLIARNPRKGDRNRRADDLYLFLEAMLSAREILYMSYIGQGIDDNAQVPPSVLISNLLDYIEQRFTAEYGSPLRDHVLTRHALQAFNPRYFSGSPGLFSYSQENARAAMSLVEKDRPERVFWTGSLDEPDDEWKMVDINMLCEFYANPARFLLKNRMGMVVSEGAFSIDDREPFGLDALQYYTLTQEHIRSTLDGVEHDRSLQLFRMSGQLPHGAPGDVLFKEMDRQTQTFTQIVQRSCQGSAPETVIVDLSIGGFAITGTIPTFGRRRMVRFRHAELKGTDLLKTWIHHLVLCAADDSTDIESLCIAKAQVATFDRTNTCREVLASLLDHYWQGLMRPLHFFPNASWKFADPGQKRGGSLKDPISEAKAVWNGAYNPGENRNTYYRICFQGTDPLDDEFAAVSQDIYGPLLDHVRIEKV